MATRAARLSMEHVQALNMIDITFNGEQKIIDAWNLYRDGSVIILCLRVFDDMLLGTLNGAIQWDTKLTSL